MLLFGKDSGNLPDCEKSLPESNEKSIPHCLSDIQRHSDAICRRDREGLQRLQSHLLAEKPCRGNTLLPGTEDRVAQFDLRRRADERPSWNPAPAQWDSRRAENTVFTGTCVIGLKNLHQAEKR